MKRASLVVTCFLSMISSLSMAGVADSPLPELVAGETTYHLYTVPGVVDLPQLETFFSCTSTDTVAMQVAVEIFGFAGGAPGNDAAATSLNVLPGGTVIFGTGPAVWIGISSDVGNAMDRGSARILSTSKKLACTAFLADPANVPPASMTYLTIIAKTKQKAAN